MHNATCKFQDGRMSRAKFSEEAKYEEQRLDLFWIGRAESDKPLRDKEDSPVCRACKKSVLAKGGTLQTF